MKAREELGDMIQEGDVAKDIWAHKARGSVLTL